LFPTTISRPINCRPRFPVAHPFARPTIATSASIVYRFAIREQGRAGRRPGRSDRGCRITAFPNWNRRSIVLTSFLLLTFADYSSQRPHRTPYTVRPHRPPIVYSVPPLPASFVPTSQRPPTRPQDLPLPKPRQATVAQRRLPSHARRLQP
jgi:hypothetical protein